VLLRYSNGFEFQTMKCTFKKKVDEFVLPLVSTVNADHSEVLFQSVSLASLCARSDVISDSLDKIWQLYYFINELYFVQTKQCGFSGLRRINAFDTRVTIQKWFCLFLILCAILLRSIAHSIICTWLFRGKMHSDWFN
jgi:hypothetical protein